MLGFARREDGSYEKDGVVFSKTDVIKAIKNHHKERRLDKGMYGPTSFAELDTMREEMHKQDEMVDLSFAFQHIVDNIIYDPELTPDSKATTIQQATNEYVTRLKSISSETAQKSGIVSSIKEKISKAINRPKEESDAPGFMLFKGKNDEWQWIARYSNKFRDDDRPSEIISDDSHKKFVALAKAGAVPAPDLWLWHEPDWKWGVGEWVTYDDSGFAIAGGRVIPEFNELAESMSKARNIRVSHGMPIWSIKRASEDKSIIVEHITKEISPLPDWAAANKFTGFYVLQEEQESDDMSISMKDKAALMQEHGISSELLDRLEAFNSADAQKAVAEGYEFKEAGNEASSHEDTDLATEATQPETTDEPVVETETQPETQAEGQPSEDVVVLLKTLTEAVVAMTSRVATLEKGLTQLEASESEKIAKKAANTPIASLTDLLKSAIGSEETRVDGRTSLAKSAPEEVQDKLSNPTPFSFVNEFIRDGGR